MTDGIEVYTDHTGEMRLVGRCRYIAKRGGQSSVFEYADEWVEERGIYVVVDRSSEFLYSAHIRPVA